MSNIVTITIEMPFRAGELALVAESDDPNVSVGTECTVLGPADWFVMVMGYDYEIEIAGRSRSYWCKHRALKRRPPPPVAKVDWAKLCHITPRQKEFA